MREHTVQCCRRSKNFHADAQDSVGMDEEAVDDAVSGRVWKIGVNLFLILCFGALAGAVERPMLDGYFKLRSHPL